MSYQPRSTNPYIMEKKLNECVGGGGFDPSVLEEIEAEISVLGSENATMAQDIIDIKGSLNSINDNLSGQDYVELITSGQTYSSAIDTLFSMINKNKIQPGKSCLRFNSAILHVVDYTDNQVLASRTYVAYNNKLVIDTFTCYASNSKFVNKTDNDVFDNSSKATTGATLRFVY